MVHGAAFGGTRLGAPEFARRGTTRICPSGVHHQICRIFGTGASKAPVIAPRPQLLRGAEDVMSTDPAPDDVCLTVFDLGAELPGGAAVRSERHLRDVAGALHSLHPEAGPEGPAHFQIIDKVSHCCAKPLLIGRPKRSPVVIESRKPLVSGHLPKRVEEGVAIVEHGSLAGGYLLAGFPFAGLPGVGPEPGLLSRD